MKIILINRAYQAIAPGKDFIDKTIQEVWPELTGLEEISRNVLATGKPFYTEDAQYMIRRSPDGPLEKAYFTWSVMRIRLPGEDE